MNLRTKAAVGMLVGFVCLLLFYQTPLMRTARQATWNFAVRWTARVFSVGTLTVEPDVAEQSARLLADNISLHSQLKDYERLRAQLASPTIESMRSIPAAVIGRPVDTFRLRFGISRGLNDGVVMGAPVVIRGNTLIGFVTDVAPTTATVQLLLHPQTNLAVEVSPDDPDGAAGRGLLQGKHYTSLSVITIPRDITIASGQAVVTIANEMIPYGLFIGTIGEVKAEENEPYQSADIQLPYDPDLIDGINVLVFP